MCSDTRAILNPTNGEVGNLIRLEVSSLMAWHGFLGSAGTKALSHSMVGHGGFRLLEENYVGGASMECSPSAGGAGIPSDKTWALFF